MIDGETVNEFNLLDEKWIKVLTTQGEIDEVSLLELFKHAHEYRSLANELPTVDIAILRLLLAIMYGALLEDVPEDLSEEEALDLWKAYYEHDKFEQDVFMKYLEKYRTRFFLFGDKPFMQTVGVHFGGGKKKEAKAKLISKIIQDVPSSDSRRFFAEKTGIGAELLNYATASRWLVAFQAYDYAGKKATIIDGTQNGGGSGWSAKIGAVINLGSNLFETLMLNFVLLDRDNKLILGKPYWENEYDKTPKKNERTPENSVELLTWQSRKCLLFRDAKIGFVNGILPSYGDVFNKDNLQKLEIMTGWHESSQKPNPFIPNRFQSSKQAWRDFSSLMVYSQESTNINERKVVPNLVPQTVNWTACLIRGKAIQKQIIPLQICSMQFSSSMESKVDDIVHDTLTINSALFGELSKELKKAVLDVLEITDNAVSTLKTLSSNIALSRGMSGDTGKIRSQIQEQAYFELDIPFRRWLQDFSEDKLGEEYKAKWYKIAEDIIQKLADQMLNLASASPCIWRKREIIVDKKTIDMNISIAENKFCASLRKVFGNMKREKMMSEKEQLSPNNEVDGVDNSQSVGNSQNDALKLVKKAVNRQLKNFQELEDSSQTRAILAELRRFAGKNLDSALSAQKHVYTYLDYDKFECLSKWDQEKIENAVFSTLTLYAIHAQGGAEDKLVHQKGAEFMQVAGNLRCKLDKQIESGSNGLNRKFESLMTAKQFGEVYYHAKSIVRLLKRENDNGFNYIKLAKDFYLLQSTNPRTKGEVLRCWGRSYWQNRKKENAENGK
ncbi:MAG: type I-E CRISPR-associated protein Cse1/CasA [Candidatus Ancillula sp.]|jgi:CRISPR system Cascade subunit CasA|nr:type I-E CRISPR-associated protein Cse1/CasA [Candidatus Ancillula sp.]